MERPALTKFGFRIRTRVGLVVDRLTIPGRDLQEAERKLRQIYRNCEILRCTRLDGAGKSAADYPEVAPLTAVAR